MRTDEMMMVQDMHDSLCDEIARMDALLARAADALNTSPRMKDMDLGSEITEYRRARLSEQLKGDQK